MSRGLAGSNGFLSSISSLFNGSKSDDEPSSPGTLRGYPDRKGTMFGSGLNSGARKGADDSMDDDGAWNLPYNYQSRQTRPYAPSPTGQYPPSRSHASEFESSTSVNMTGQPFQSASTLVPAQGRPSMNLSSNVSFPSTAYPPLKHTWKRIRAWCDSNYNELADTLNWPATELQLEDLEMTIGYTLPSAVRDSYLCYDGQELESNNTCSDGLFFGLPLLSVEQIAEEWRFWRSVDDDIATGANAEVKGWMGSCPAGWVRAEYSCRGWIPLITDRVGNYIGVDLSPNPQGGGSPGQVILFGRDFDTKVVLWRGEGEGGWGRFLQYVAEELEGGELWTLEDNNSSDSNDEEDAIGYESYFSNGGAGASKGGGDRGGDGAIGFKLRGEYKGWPVLEAWADRSMRCWDEVGQPASQPLWQKDTPSVLVDEDEAHPAQANNEAEGSRRGPQIVTPEGESHPLDPSSTAVPSTSQSTAGVTHTPPSSTLSPPLPSSKAERVKQRRREEAQWQQKEGHSSPVAAQGQIRRPPPAPAAPLDLPTIDDVRAAHAAAMASQGRSGTYHYDVERARPPAGMGGMGMGMGMASTAGRSGYAPRYTLRQGSGHRDVHLNVSSREDDGLELETRVSVDASNSGRRGSAQSANDERLIDHSRSSPLHSPRVSLSGGQASGGSNGRTLYSPSRNGEGLIDAMSTTDLNAGNSGKMKSALGDNVSLTNEPIISSPLATQAPVMSSMQDNSGTDNRAALPAIASS